VTGVDTNVLLRYLVEDDEEQASRVHRFLAATRNAGETIYVSCVVLCEVAWALGQVYGWEKQSILCQVATLLDIDIFQIEDEDLVRNAVELSRKSRGSFADCLIGQLQLARGCKVTVTFDRGLRSNPSFSVF